MKWLEVQIWNNAVEQWLIALGVLTSSFWFAQFVFKVSIQRFENLSARTTTLLDDFLVQVLKKTGVHFFLVCSFAFSLLFIKMSEDLSRILWKGIFLAVVFQVGIWGNTAIPLGFDLTLQSNTEAGSSRKISMDILKLISRLVFFSLLLLMALDSVGVNITALIASLGVGGIAIALAVQNILGDLFASLSIVLDRPFELGDFIVIGDFKGAIEKIGLKTTRVRSLSGEQLIFPNSDLLQSRIRNFKRMQERRIAFNINVTYQTSLEQLRRIPQMIREAVEKQTSTRWERSHFQVFGDSSLQFETVYWVLSPDYNIYMDIQQAINLSVFECFSKEQIEFAYPTRTLQWKSDINLPSFYPNGHAGARREVQIHE